jgi:hypothetical protein
MSCCRPRWYMSPLPDAPCACAVCTCAREVPTRRNFSVISKLSKHCSIASSTTEVDATTVSQHASRTRSSRSVHSRRSDTHTDVHTDLNSRFERVPRFGRVQRAGCPRSSSNSDLGPSTSDERGRTVRQSDVDVFNDPVRVVAVRWRSNSTRSCPDAEVHARARANSTTKPSNEEILM